VFFLGNREEATGNRAERVFTLPSSLFPWKDIETGKAKDIALQPGDNVFIGPGTASREPGALERLLPILRDGALFFSVLRH